MTSNDSSIASINVFINLLNFLEADTASVTVYYGHLGNTATYIGNFRNNGDY